MSSELFSSSSAEVEYLRRELREQKRRAEYYKQLWSKERSRNLQTTTKVDQPVNNEIREKTNSYEENFKKFMTSVQRRKCMIKKKPSKPKTPSREDLLKAHQELDQRFQNLKIKHKLPERKAEQEEFLTKTKNELLRLEKKFSSQPEEFLRSSTLHEHINSQPTSSPLSRSFSFGDESPVSDPAAEYKQGSPSPVQKPVFSSKRDTSYCGKPQNSKTRFKTPLIIVKENAVSGKKLHKRPKKEPSPEQQAIIKTKIDEEIEVWARNKSLRILLNKIFNHPYRGEEYLKPDVTWATLRKNYHKAVAKIHPDKHISSSFETRCRNEKLFLVLSSAYERYQKKYCR